jgi:hypothetical protein
MTNADVRNANARDVARRRRVQRKEEIGRNGTKFVRHM